jgi:hypothetical protein
MKTLGIILSTLVALFAVGIWILLMLIFIKLCIKNEGLQAILSVVLGIPGGPLGLCAWLWFDTWFEGKYI